MEHYRCVNDPFAYCDRHPGALPKPSNPNPGEPSLQSGGQCSKNPAQCSSYVTNTQKSEEMPHKSTTGATKSQKKGIKKKK